MIVIGKADLGFSKKFGEIIKGREYDIKPEDMNHTFFEFPEDMTKQPITAMEGDDDGLSCGS